MRKGVLYSCIFVCVFAHMLLAALPVKCADPDGFVPISDTFESSIFQDSLTVEGLTTANEPSLSNADEGRIYYNSDDDTFKASLSNGAYLDLVFNDAIGDGDWTKNGNDIFSAVSGNVGIGVNPPISKFQVENGSVLFNGTSGAIPVTGAGTRMMWVPSLAAFRAGNVTGTQWDALGAGSVGLGTDSIATGASAVAISQDSSATANFTTAIGFTSSATNLGSTAVGPFANASGSTSASFSFGGAALGDFSAAIGVIPGLPAPFGTTPLFTATGENSLAISNGFMNTVADSSIIIGRGVDASNFLTNTAVTDENSISFGMNSTVPTLYISDSGGVGLTGNVGIGNTTPTTKVDISGAATIREIAAPAVSPANQGRIYFDSTDDEFKVSENAGSYGVLVPKVLQLVDTTGAEDINAGATITWESSPIIDSSVFSFSGPANTVSLQRNGIYRISYNVVYRQDGAGNQNQQRKEIRCEIQQDATPLNQGLSYSYTRNGDVDDGNNTASIMINVTAAPDTIAIACSGDSSGAANLGTSATAGESTLSIELIR